MRYREPHATIVEIHITTVFDEMEFAPTAKPIFVSRIPDTQHRVATVQEPGCFEASDFYMCR